MSDTPQLPSKRLKSEDVAVSPSSQHMSHGTSYLTPSHFPHAYASSYTPQPPPPPQFHYGQQTYVGQPLSLVQPDHHQQQHQQQQQQQQHQHHYQSLSHPLTSYHASQLPGGHSRKRPASDLETPPMAQPVGIPSMPTYSMPSASAMLSGHGHNAMSGGGLGISGSTDVGLHLGPGAVQDLGSSSSGPKKGRTNTPWTREEEMRLKAMRDAGNSWSDIAKEFPNRTEGSVKKHWYKDMHYTEISEDEGSFKAALISAIKEYDANKWKIIGQKMGKPAKACEQFAREHLGKT